MSGCPASASRSRGLSRSTHRDRRDTAAASNQAMEGEVTSMVSRIRIVLPVVALGLLLSACGYNTIPTLEEQAKEGYAAQEKNVLTAVVEARAKATQIKLDASDLTDPAKLKAFQDAQNQLTGVLGRLLAVTENYPDLKSNANFLALQSQLEGTENRIAVARRDYIDAVRAFNLSLRTFPTVLWAKTVFSGEKPMAEFAATEGSDKPPPVKF